ncbi:polysaccharide deacetylase family protein [Streptomyces albipurpureus]|uniref:Polysaccharide deacetylase family protein n=1 Tax=Streptomyces albipurpureus TaxID=2897419 RepID=A0ABT0UNH7_9ACTN|nr:polysaccharide deacetylase family protein [Streptomyces sp. CWNU-1]MCM2389544.1 polysaccharide deacetylase family protein [Streptomyces sp. CWNU-1]
MKKDQTPLDRRSVLRIGACLGAAATAGLLMTEGARSPGGSVTSRPGSGASTSTGAGARPAGGPQIAQGPPVKASSYRLQPMTEYSPPRLRRALPPVRTQPFLKLPETGRTMVLTFDDGPDPRYTPGILRTLRDYDVQAMFFVCGEMAEANRDLLREMADDGHVIGNHSWSHPLIPRLPPSRIRSELGSTSEVVEEVLGSAPLWYRAPFGAWNRHSFEIGAELGMEPLAWTVDTLDWTEPGTGTIVRRVLDGAGPGVVVLSHDAGGDRSQSVKALRRYLPGLLEDGYQITVPRR